MRMALFALIALALAAGALWDDFWVQRPALAAARTTVTNWADAQKADTLAANTVAQHCAASAASSLKAGVAIGKAARVVAPAKPGEEQPMVGNDTLRDIVGQGR